MNKFFYICAVLMTAVSFSACSSDGELGEGHETITDPYDWKFQFNEDGTLKTTPCLIFSSGSDLQKTLVGNGWKHVASYEIKQDGSCETEEYYSSRYGVSPHYYYFENENTLYNLCYSLAYAGRLVKTEHKWAYFENETLIVIDPEVSAVDHPNCIQIIGKDGNRIWITERIAGRYVDDKYMPVYVVAQYDKMTEGKLNDLLSEAGIK